MSGLQKHKSLPPRLAAALGDFLEWLRVKGSAEATLESRGAGISQLLRFCAGRGLADVREVTGETLRAYQTWLHQKSYTPWTLLNHLESVRRFFAFLEKTDVLLVDPTAVLITPHMGERLPRHVLSKAQMQRVLDCPDTQTKVGLRNKALLETFYSTGLRCAEMTALTVHDVDVRNGFVRVLQGKGRKDRVVPLGKKAADYIAEYLRVVRSEWSKARRDERALWLSMYAPHGPLKSQAVALIVKNCLRACGIAQGRAHVMRHSCATHLVAGGANIAYVQRILGHRSLDTTQRYTRVALPEVKRAHRRAHPRARREAQPLAAPTAGKGKIKGHYTAYDF